jgi:REP element-mobilizing transposase RayT
VFDTDTDNELEPVGYEAYLHCVFSTKGQQPLIAPELQRDLWICIDGVARLHGMRTLAVGGTGNHCHILLFLPEDISVDQAVRLMKSGSAAWVSEFHGKRDFAWQEGYGAFSLSRSDIPSLSQAILNQAEFHRTVDYQTEFLALLKENGIEFDPTDGWE